MSVHSPLPNLRNRTLANRRQTMATASLRQFSLAGGDIPTLAEIVEAERERQAALSGTITLEPMVTTADEPTAPTTVSAKTLAQDPGFIWIAAGSPDFPALTTWAHPPGTEVRGALLGGNQWIQLFGPDATQWMLERIDRGLAVLRNGAVAPPVMVVPTQEVVGGEPLAPTITTTTTADLEPSAPTEQVVTTAADVSTVGTGALTPTPIALRGATTSPITTGVTRTRVLQPPELGENGAAVGIAGAGVGVLAVLAIGAFFVFGRRR